MKNFETEVTIIGFKPYKFENQDTKEVISGVKINIATDSVSSEDGGGGDVFQIIRPYEELEIFKSNKYPCKGIVTFQVPNLTQKPSIVSIKPIKIN